MKIRVGLPKTTGYFLATILGATKVATGRDEDE